jgi:hypothetical protein
MRFVESQAHSLRRLRDPQAAEGGAACSTGRLLNTIGAAAILSGPMLVDLILSRFTT